MGFVSIFYNWCPVSLCTIQWKTEVSILIVVHGRHFVRHIGSCNPICVKLLQVMSGVIPRNLKKRRLYLTPFSWRPQMRHTHTHTHTHTNTQTPTDRKSHTHDDSIRRNAMRCISPINGSPCTFICITTSSVLQISNEALITWTYNVKSHRIVNWARFVSFKLV